jgi:predicted dehydrogenase
MIRRNFIKTTALAGAAVSMMPSSAFGMKESQKTKIGFIGVGGRGRNHLRVILQRNDVEVPAICDIDPEAVQQALAILNEAGYKKPEVYSDGEYAFMKLLQRDDIQGVIIATPWLWHTPMTVAAMKAGKYAGVEVSATVTLEESWDLVNTYEETGVPMMILENVCYRRDVMAVLQMVRENLFGELIHFRCGYQHDLRNVKFNPGVTFGEGAEGEARWRTQHSIDRNGDNYPTHGLGPIAEMCNINRGNRFISLTSTATKARGLHEYIVNNPAGGINHPNAAIEWKQGDVITTTVTTARGESIIITHNCNLPRPYSLGFWVQGTKGLTEFDSHTQRIYIEGVSKEADAWEKFQPYADKYDHPLWRKYGENAQGAGHGGMDFFVDHAFVEIVKRKLKAPLDAYDAAAWSSISPLSEISIEQGGAPVPIPDFTRGRWITRKPVFALNDDY